MDWNIYGLFLLWHFSAYFQFHCNVALESERVRKTKQVSFTASESQVDNRFVVKSTCLWACTWGVPRWTDTGSGRQRSGGGEGSEYSRRRSGPGADVQTAWPSAMSSAATAAWRAPTTHHHITVAHSTRQLNNYTTHVPQSSTKS